MTSAQQNGELKDELLRETKFEETQSLFDKSTHQSIGKAVLGNHVNVVEYLLGHNGIETHLKYRNSRGENVLHLASRLCNPEVFRLLVPRFPEGINAEDDQGDTPLVRVIMSPAASRYESARILLRQSSTDWNSHSLEWQWSALRAAVLCRDLDMCCILILIGNIDPVSILTRGCKNEDDMLGYLIDLFELETEANSSQLVGSVD